MPTVEVAGHPLEYVLHPAEAGDAPTLVFLHEGLGSVSLWRDFPARVGAASGAAVLAYSRLGYGQSPVLCAPRTPDYMHHEAEVVLPQVLQALGITAPILVGHSDGASIALIHAGAAPSSPRAVVAMAPHVFVEDVSITSIAAARETFATTDLRDKLARHHRDPEATFRGWNDIWLHPDFRAWNIEAYLPQIACPVLTIQGVDDEYGTLAQLDAISRGVRGRVERVELASCRHSPHRDQADATLAAITRFIVALR